MNQQWQNRCGMALLSVISLGILLCGCGSSPVLRAEIVPTTTSTPMLSGVIRAGELEEVVPLANELEGWRISDIAVKGHILIGRTPKVQGGLVAIDLQTQAVTGIDGPLSLGAWLTKTKTMPERYYVWEDGSTRDGVFRENIYVVDLYSGETAGVIEGRWGNISGSMVVYAMDGGHPNSWDLYAKNLDSGEVIPIAVRERIQSRPKVNGEWVVYLDIERVNASYEKERIRAYNLNTGEDLVLGVTRYATQSEGGTYGIGNGRIVWIGWRGEREENTYGLHVFDTQTREVYTPPHLTVDDISPTFDMAGDLLLFGHSTCYDLAQDVLFEIPYPHNTSGFIYMSQDYIVFRIEVSEPNIIEILQTPGAATPTLPPAGAAPPLRMWKLLVIPIIRE